MTAPDPALKYVLRELTAPAREFYRRLDADEFGTTFCSACERFAFPPRERCSTCGEELTWRPLPRRGSIYAYTAQERGLRFTSPDVVGIIELDEGVRVFGVFDDGLEHLAIGLPVEVHLRRDVPGMTLLGFKVVPK
jgi:uncharacterized OB-fold protein